MLGAPVQIAYAVRDAEAAAASWASKFRAGPFFVRRHIAVSEVRHRGAPSVFDHTSAYGQWGDVMVELVQDHTVGPSPVADVVGPGGEGLHHLAYFVDDLPADEPEPLPLIPWRGVIMAAIATAAAILVAVLAR